MANGNTDKTAWQPGANIAVLQERARLYQQLRGFFEQRKVLEVDTPVLQAAGVTDPHIESIQVPGYGWLQTSPEYPMKRLLAAGSGDIYQISKVFRKEQNGRYHNHEFTLLEWYRLGFDQWQLMGDVADLVEHLLGITHFEHISYQALFQQYLGLDPLNATIEELKFEARQHINIEMPRASRDDWLHLLLSHLIEPELAKRGALFVYDFPPSQAALARINSDDAGHAVAARFELYIQGIEIANGFHELNDAKLQRQRFEADNQQRQAMGLHAMPIDERLLAALAHGLPDCAGVALGLDRLLMLKLGQRHIDQVLSFTDR